MYISKICHLKELFGYIATWKYRNSHQRYSMKKGILRNFAKFTGKDLCQSLVRWQKGTLAQVFCKTSKNTFFTEHIRATASARVMNFLLFLILESVNMIIVLICHKNMTIFSKTVSNSLFVQIVSNCIGKKHLNKYFTQQCQIICCNT